MDIERKEYSDIAYLAGIITIKVDTGTKRIKRR